MIVRLAAEAERDLEEIGDHIARDNPARAAGFVRELRAACLGLSAFAERFPLVPRYENEGVRHRVHGNYLIFYRVEEDAVIVIHVLHGATDYGDVLFPS
jgi:toxin ParE1/3/4